MNDEDLNKDSNKIVGELMYKFAEVFQLYANVIKQVNEAFKNIISELNKSERKMNIDEKDSDERD